MRARTRQDLNLRAGPGTDHPVLVILPSGATVEVQDDRGTWWQVNALGLVGWVHRGYLILADPAAISDREWMYKYGDSQITIVLGDITDSEAAVIVSSDDYRLTMGGGVSAAIAGAGGSSIRLDAAKKVPAQIGDVVVTTAGSLPAQYIFHAITIGPGAQETSPEQVVKGATTRCMELLDAFALESIAFPAIGSGKAGSSSSEVLAWMAEALASHLAVHTRPVRVSLYLWPHAGELGSVDYSATLEQFFGALVPLSSQVETLHHQVSTANEVQPATAPSSHESERKRMLVRLAELQQEQEQTEQALATASREAASELRQRLNRIVDERVELARRGKESAMPGVEVFISYAREDAGYRDGLGKALAVLELSDRISVFHDQQIGAGADWDSAIQTRLDSADLIILLLSMDFLSSKYIDTVEMKRAKERYDRNEVRVVPIVVRDCPWKLTWLKVLNALPVDDEGLRPVSAWPDPDKAYTRITEAIDSVIDHVMGAG